MRFEEERGNDVRKRSRHASFCVRLGCFGDLAAFDTGGANLHPLYAPLRALDANGLQVWVEAPTRAIVSVRNVVAELRPLAADFASFSHDFLEYLRAIIKAPPFWVIASQWTMAAPLETKIYNKLFCTTSSSRSPHPATLNRTISLSFS